MVYWPYWVFISSINFLISRLKLLYPDFFQLSPYILFLSSFITVSVTFLNKFNSWIMSLKVQSFILLIRENIPQDIPNNLCSTLSWMSLAILFCSSVINNLWLTSSSLSLSKAVEINSVRNWAGRYCFHNRCFLFWFQNLKHRKFHSLRKQVQPKP